jgi:general secretion pathway protein G
MYCNEVVANKPTLTGGIDMTRTRKNSGFTLIEILIVVIILGILAAIVIPQFTNASTEAKQSSMASQLQTLRSQIGTYVAQHGGTAPSGTTTPPLWTQLTEETDATGAVSTSANGFGPYFTNPVANPLIPSTTATDSGTAVVVTSTKAQTAPDGTAAWVYNPATGEIHGVGPDPSSTTGAYMLTDDGVTKITAFTTGT